MPVIKKLIIQKHGLPAKRLSDNGLEFRNNAVETLLKNQRNRINVQHPGTLRNS